MKYRLNERFILDERFILAEDALNEASSADVVTSRLADVRANLDSFITKVAGIIPKIAVGKEEEKATRNAAAINTAVGKLMKLARSIQNTINAKGGLDSIKTDIQEYYNTLTNLFTSLGVDVNADRAYRAIRDNLQDLQDITST